MAAGAPGGSTTITEPTRPRNVPRWLAIDQTRGAAMVLVWLSHFALVYFRTEPGYAPARLMFFVTRAASPAFVVVSGMLLGMLAARNARHPERIRARFFDRGLFLLLVAHLVIWAAHIARAGVHGASRILFMTDTIGVCLLVAPHVVARLGRLARLVASALAFSACWTLIVYGHGDPPGGLAGEFLAGSLRPDDLDYAFPVLPWMAVFIAATVLGERLDALRTLGLEHVSRLALRASLAVLLCALPAIVLHRLVSPDTLLWSFTLSSQKSPPGLVYVGFYGAIAIALFASFVELERRQRDWPGGRLLAMIGRNSLFAFVAQYVVYYTGFALLRPSRSPWWGAWLVASVAALVAVTAAWNAVGGNRWLTLGLARVRPRRSSSFGAYRAENS